MVEEDGWERNMTLLDVWKELAHLHSRLEVLEEESRIDFKSTLAEEEFHSAIAFLALAKSRAAVAFNLEENAKEKA